MARYIDADDFKKFLQALCNAGAPYEEVIQLLDKQPTAYDVEAKVAELESKLCHEAEVGKGYCDGECESCVATKAIEIVRSGGKE